MLGDKRDRNRKGCERIGYASTLAMNPRGHAFIRFCVCMHVYVCLLLPHARKRVHVHMYIYARIEISYCHVLYPCCIYPMHLCAMCVCLYVAAVSVIRVSDLHHSFNYKRQIRTEPHADSVVGLLRVNPLPHTRTIIYENIARKIIISISWRI